MKSIAIVIIMWCFTLSAFGKHPSVPVFANTIRCLDLYKKNHGGNLPENWQVFASSGYMTEDLLKDAKKYFDMENRFQFVDPPVTISHQGINFSIVFMENEPGHKDASGREARRLGIEDEDGNLRSTRYPEVVLNRLFREAGSDLNLYTKKSPPPPVVHPPNQPDTRGMVLGPSAEPFSQKIRRVARSLNPFSQQAPAASATTDSRSSWALWLIGSAAGVLLIAVAAVIFRKRSKSL